MTGLAVCPATDHEPSPEAYRQPIEELLVDCEVGIVGGEPGCKESWLTLDPAVIFGGDDRPPKRRQRGA